MKWLLHFIYAFIFLTTLNSCQQNESVSFLAIGHTRQAESNDKEKVLEVVEKIPFEKYDALLLGGDLVLESTKDESQLQYLNDVFNIGAPNTMWAMGNHDYRNNPHLAKSFTKRPTYFAHKKGNVTFLVLDTQLDSCNISGEQLNLFKKTIQHLTKTDQLIILHHKLIWMPDHPILDNKTHATTNGMVGDCFYCLMKNNFYQDIYPELVQLKRRGIEVILIGGDIGSKVNQFEYQTKEGIVYLATGLEDGRKDNQVLEFKYEVGKKLTWKFIPILELVK